MNWITEYVRPRLDSLIGRRETPENLWIKCPESGEMVFHRDVEDNQWVIPGSGYHMKIPAMQRLTHFYDDGDFQVITNPEVVQDPLKFRDQKKYTDRLRENRQKTGLDDSNINATGKLEGMEIVTTLHDFAFMGGSLGMAAGEAFIAAAQMAVARKAAFVICTASGGARMQEGTLSLMQMPRSTLAIQEVKDAGLPYVVVLCDPTSGGVSASYAMLGDVHLAEPGAMIAFSGPRVIEQTIREKLPEGFQRSEFLREKGAVDIVVDRRDLKATLARVLGHLMPKQAAAEKDVSTLPVEAPSADAPVPLADKG